MFIQENYFEYVVCEMAAICLGLNVLSPGREQDSPTSTTTRMPRRCIEGRKLISQVLRDTTISAQPL